VGPAAPASVHLTAYPTDAGGGPDPRLRTAMAMARQLVTLGRDARAGAGTPVRQPLRRAVVTVPPEHRDLLDDVHDVIARELNVKSVEPAGSADAGLVNVVLKPNFRALGPAFGDRTGAVAAAIRRADGDTALAALDAHGPAIAREVLATRVDVVGLDAGPQAVPDGQPIEIGQARLVVDLRVAPAG